MSGRGKGKSKGRGGGGRGSGQRMCVDNAEELEIRDRIIEESREARARRRAEEDDEAPEGATAAPAATAEVKTVFRAAPVVPAAAAAAAPAAAAEDDDEEGTSAATARNPNFMKFAEGDAGMNRKEREAAEAIKKKEDYLRRHLAGQTEEARKDMERLAIVRRRREEAAKKRAAEGRAPGMSATGIESSSEDDSDSDEDAPKTAKAAKAPSAPKAAAAVAAPVISELQAKKKAAAAEVVVAADAGPAETPKLKAMDIKKMNGDALKEACRERALDVQGQKKDLMKRLLDFEAARS